MDKLPTERVRRTLSSVGQIRIGAIKRDGETAFDVRLNGPNESTEPERRPSTGEKISIPADMRGDETEYIVERPNDEIILIPVADDFDERTIVLSPAPPSGQLD